MHRTKTPTEIAQPETIQIGVDAFIAILKERFQSGYLTGYTQVTSEHLKTVDRMITEKVMPILIDFRAFVKEKTGKECLLKMALNSITQSIECALIVDEELYLDLMDPVTRVAFHMEQFLKEEKVLPLDWDFSISVIPNKPTLDFAYLCNNFSVDIPLP